MSDVIKVNFGKYAGQPVEVLAQDERYTEWLIDQPWFKERYPAIYQVLINARIEEPQDSPEHNRLSYLAMKNIDAIVAGLTPFDFGEWDFKMKQAAQQRVDEHAKDEDFPLQEALEKVEQLKSKRVYNFEFEGKSGADIEIHSYIQAGRMDVSDWYQGHNMPKRYTFPIESKCPENFALFVELKPTVGDDWPKVIRQVKNFKEYRSDQRSSYCHFAGEIEYLGRIGDRRRIVITERIEASNMTPQEVREMFKAAGVEIYLIDELLSSEGSADGAAEGEREPAF